MLLVKGFPNGKDNVSLIEGKQLLVGDQYLAVNIENIQAAARKVRHR